MSKEWLTKQWVMKYWEQDWQDDHVYFNISESGTIRKYNTLTDELFEYEMERVEH